jgi:hypothetical protein
MSTSSTVTITRRIDPCGCGCKGADPWHRKEFERVLHDEREESGRCQVKAYGYASDPAEYDRVAFVSAPWSEERVKVVRLIVRVEGKSYVLGWYFAL